MSVTGQCLYFINPYKVVCSLDRHNSRYLYVFSFVNSVINTFACAILSFIRFVLLSYASADRALVGRFKDRIERKSVWLSLVQLPRKGNGEI